MINSEINTIDVTGPTAFHKQPILAAKKVALRDNSNLNRDTNPAILLPVEGQSFMDSAKISGIKRHTPDYSSSSLLNNNSPHEHFNYPRRKVSQLNGKNTHPNYIASKTSVPRFKVSNDDDQMTERFIRLQNFIKQCDGSNHRENIQLLLRLSPLELSRHAVELEKRAIQLTIEEGQEMQRMQALNILGKPLATRNTMPIIQHKN
ncbi:uncharacterized protein LOC111878454 isoform X1 [Lactuca sativa]|uniref:Uncharacterized protein n=1 Tax=Lactuca sativa TaxID=4236 RepID=A0A9R1UPI5_LACSA|nr:uncharacterized protein LOC111878454 isoform X1 [Lactuca sativa]XP_042753638.1 uncharacterized protein LOC111878454 isoform X1 [Lactuca sativa]KAJ0191053.1 hypothetical protein LSAT_V11C800399730 [Lactuca sativa]